MQTYTFLNTKSKKIEEHQLNLSDYDSFKLANPHLERYFDSAPGFTFDGKSFNGVRSKIDNGFKEVLSKIAEKNPASPLAAEYRRPSNKEVKTKEIIKKHVEKRRKLLNGN